MKWPKGKYNGEYIQGIRISLQIHVLDWYFLPRFNWYFGEPYLIWICFTLRAKTEYKRVIYQLVLGKFWESFGKVLGKKKQKRLKALV